jgi:hypothetical protein
MPSQEYAIEQIFKVNYQRAEHVSALNPSAETAPRSQ